MEVPGVYQQASVLVLTSIFQKKTPTNLRNVEVVVLVLRKAFKELYKEAVVVQCSLVVICVVVHIRIIRVGEPHTHWGLHWNGRRWENITSGLLVLV